MSKPLFHVDRTGLLTSFQDLGRKQQQSKGVVASGAMDATACQIANLLVGNTKEEACIEVVMQGPVLTVLAKEATIAIVGADLSPTINGEPVEIWRTLHLKKGDRLAFGAPRVGVYAYIAVRGGYSVPAYLGSKSFYGMAKLGTAIEKNRIIHCGESSASAPARGLRSPFHYQKETTVRVILGPHEDHFTKEDIRSFLSQPYQIGQADRMGYRLKGEHALSDVYKKGIASDAIPLGGIQVPEDGFPIVLLADRQTTGGYRRIGTVISADIGKLVQVPPGGTLYFQEATLQEAYQALKAQQGFLKKLELLLR